jgi:hypothetical protein
MQRARHCLSLAAVAALTCGLGGNLPTETAYAENSVATANRIVAVYRVDIGNFNLGEFKLTTTFRGEEYQMRGEGRFKVLEGLIYEWRGVTASYGRVTDTGPEPTMYAFNFADSAKMSERLRMTFEGRAVADVSIIPRNRPLPRTIPVTKEQLEGVLDPMSGAFLSAQSENPNGDLAVCDKTLPVFPLRRRWGRDNAPGPQDVASEVCPRVRERGPERPWRRGAAAFTRCRCRRRWSGAGGSRARSPAGQWPPRSSGRPARRARSDWRSPHPRCRPGGGR